MKEKIILCYLLTDFWLLNFEIGLLHKEILKDFVCVRQILRFEVWDWLVMCAKLNMSVFIYTIVNVNTNFWDLSFDIGKLFKNK